MFWDMTQKSTNHISAMLGLVGPGLDSELTRAEAPGVCLSFLLSARACGGFVSIAQGATLKTRHTTAVRAKATCSTEALCAHWQDPKGTCTSVCVCVRISIYKYT